MIKNKTTEFYMLGWGVTDLDSHYIFNFLVHETTENPWVMEQHRICEC